MPNEHICNWFYVRPVATILSSANIASQDPNATFELPDGTFLDLCGDLTV